MKKLKLFCGCDCCIINNFLFHSLIFMKKVNIKDLELNIENVGMISYDKYTQDGGTDNTFKCNTDIEDECKTFLAMGTCNTCETPKCDTISCTCATIQQCATGNKLCADFSIDVCNKLTKEVNQCVLSELCDSHAVCLETEWDTCQKTAFNCATVACIATGVEDTCDIVEPGRN